jgi:hypothetical protein
MLNFCTVHGKKASFLGEHELLFVHCVSKQPFILIPEGLSWMNLNVVRFIMFYIVEFADCGVLHWYKFTLVVFLR